MTFTKTVRIVALGGLMALGALGGLSLAKPAQAAGESAPLPHQDWGFSGPLGTYDKAALQRGFKVYREVCSACHSMRLVAYRNLSALGYNEDQIKNIASQYTFTDGPDDEGEMFERPGLPSDHFKDPYPNKKAAAAVNNGALPPDLSLITKARHSGPDYVYALLTGYEPAPAGFDVPSGKYYNEYMPGHVIAMAPPLSDDIVMYEDGTPTTTEQYSKDVVEFLTWAGDPHMEQRKQTGIKVILFLLAFAAVMYAYKKRIWSGLH